MAVEFDGFEVGDADLTDGDGAFWDGGFVSGGTLAGNETDIVFSGTYSAKWVLDNAGEYAQTYHTVDAANEAFFQFKFYIGSHAAGSVGNRLTVGSIRNSTTQLVSILAIYQDSNTYKIGTGVAYEGGASFVTGTTTYNIGEWHTIETRWYVHATDGGSETWVDGGLEVSNLGLDTEYANSTVTRIFAGGTLNAGYTAATFYEDDVKYDTTYIGISEGTLRRWNGTAWVKAKAMTRLAGSWQSRPIKRWTGAEWVEVDGIGS